MGRTNAPGFGDILAGAMFAGVMVFGPRMGRTCRTVFGMNLAAPDKDARGETDCGW